jgi:hypothetical protein
MPFDARLDRSRPLMLKSLTRGLGRAMLAGMDADELQHALGGIVLEAGNR